MFGFFISLVEEVFEKMSQMKLPQFFFMDTLN